MLAEDVRELECENEHLRDANRELQELLGMELPRPMNCGNCEHFIQHYIKVGLHYYATYAGHCVHGRVTNRKPDGKTCRYYVPGSKKKF